ncbi:MAG: hypothetical protein A3F26_00475 [Candidatus Ryanbacteria bacterium RIFCSPHIGHO2_12_FULL_47_12b]|uniref:Carbonic anhydrase n=2 Tax=Candidatus Ryaniibacteriota TaxID=1817914 RepID=A0A1G2H5K0_9BACT|nr:MAG: hypothetical protein A2844_01045 [Candidatus Ryanbacteria bacterium RIFCSPHIGHO2_01_FULL_48_80]OGZ49651.1 MAG: hypothetical protein A3C83_00405 [Candidatus Ryanbacteria bacterium RIFCSPHIGHO2_02_FULL_47_25]OGZ51551.1 MAG: hypothetical protein A3A29_00845 [Candidatus Ryanbacteria bacterium RIFCSPLOWO2_01_FULL_47_79]OGZ53305.1 MAG: hypothetical protein A3F26_00475 [Candidatus Ryanbacteria bacterium RIFCSPHIGHO2_12_FULL_47_12b]OGZ56951.1 MAG: hypothetical protein A3J04_02975 [Candidatus Ry
MNTIFSFQSNKTHYTADACIVWCFDDRFSKLLDEYIKQQNFAHVDLVKIAGGAKDLASPENEPARAYLLDQIAKSIKLHHTKEIILMAHSECGAYGGSTDVDFYTNELQRARESVQKQFPDITVECIYADFELLQHV